LRTFWEVELDTAGAAAGMREGMELARRVGDRRAMERFANNIAFNEFTLGNWDVALNLLREFLSDTQDPGQRAALLENVIVIRAVRGEHLIEEFAELERLAAGESNRLKSFRVDAEASRALGQGAWASARELFHQYVELDPSNAPITLYWAARMALWNGDTDGARADLAAMDATGFHGRVVENRRATIRAGLAAAEGRTGDALAEYRDVIRIWRELSLGNDEHFTAMDMVFLIGASNPEVQPYAAAAREFFERVGARPFVERLDAAFAETSGDVTAVAEPVTASEAPISA